MMVNDDIIFKGENDNENYRRVLVQEQYPLLTKEDVASIKSLDELSLLGMTRAMDQVRRFRRERNDHALLEWVEQYENVFEERFIYTFWHKEFYVYKGIAFAQYRQKYREAQECIDIAKRLMIGGTPDVLTQATIIKEIGSYHSDLCEFPEAKEYYVQVLELVSPDDEACKMVYMEALSNLGHVYFVTGRYSEADALFDKVMQYNEDRQMNGYLLDHVHLGKAHLASLQKDVDTCVFHEQKAWQAVVAYGLKGIEPYLKALDLKIRLHKIGVFEHDGKPLVLHDIEDIDKIYYQYYMVHPEYSGKLA